MKLIDGINIIELEHSDVNTKSPYRVEALYCWDPPTVCVVVLWRPIEHYILGDLRFNRIHGSSLERCRYYFYLFLLYLEYFTTLMLKIVWLSIIVRPAFEKISNSMAIRPIIDAILGVPTRCRRFRCCRWSLGRSARHYNRILHAFQF